jgi:tetratricopeptide (TPR) repeat protein
VNYRIFISGICLLVFAGIASATQQASKQRLDAIWSAVDSRIVQQTDVWFDDGDYPKSINLLALQTAYEPDNYEAVTNLGWMQENVEEWDAALATYKLFLKNNPKDKDRALPEAQFLFNRKRYAEVPALLEPVLNLKPHPNNFRILAHSYERLKKYEDAKRVWKLYLAIAPNDAPAKVNLERDEKRTATGKTN